ncbi:unnamed protein product [Rotaria sordida]|uniref:Calcineurin-like phosphoesterase domain-containing protein n=1 Tax=Rotaria sordida TaxID=392033 RepID=A0A815SE23_9BILA|nr:unnamed protein product [Rotaria sordida]
MFYTLVNFFFYVDSEECFNDLQSTLQDIDICQQPFNDLYCTTSSSFCNSDIPIPLSPSSYWLSTSERTNTSKHFLDLQSEQESDFEFFLHPSIPNSPHISVHVNGVAIPMRSIYNTTRPYRSSRGRSVHWKDEIVHPSKNENYYNRSNSTNIKKNVSRISLNTSLPYHTKLNIRIQVNRLNCDDFNENNHIKAKATVQRLNPQYDHQHSEALQRAYCQHYLISSPNERMITKIRTNIPIPYEKSSPYRHISIPVSLPIDQRLFLYIQNDEIFARLFLNYIHAKSTNTDFYTFALLSDIHIGDTAGNAIGRARSAVAKINQLAANVTTNLQAVFITGDVTNSAMPSQYTTLRDILNNLTIPYYPIIGNHDQWLYNSTWEDIAPVGDQFFAATFKDILNQPNIINYPNGTVWNPIHSCQSWFQNYRLQLHNNIFISLDWNSRHHAAASLGYKGSMPGADLYDFNGGTFSWLEEQLKQLEKQSSTIILLQHHPFRAPFYIPGEIYAFSELKRLRIEYLLRQYTSLNYFGVFAGHFHMWSDGKAFDNMPKFRQFETDACKVAQAVALVTANIKTGEIMKIEKMYGDEPTKP